ncbi:MAG: glycosyltransferase [Bacteroidales bacterium]|nr:glycosyltransferase [Bacteroidales bacterium]MCF8344255.1 glycosyltransferase [Bacteroidales bacterium]MCF8349914.1 glycosyltransferase [Bacteroidales bacterium]MCF8376795.1 glycosyltransferase [Bacteroidales bacterium]MCF8401971.1 glycosyltransferase [Bacteroidales bacterium]
MPKKVLIIGPAHPLRGGLANYNERLAKEYQKKGNQVHIETFSLQYPSLLFPGKSQYSNEPAPDDLSINASINSINPLNWISTGNRLAEEKYDLVISKYWLPFMAPCLGTILRRIKKNGHSKVISILDNIVPHEKRPGDKALSNYFVKSVDGFVAMSESVLDDLNQFTTQKPKAFCPHPLYDNFGEQIPKEQAIEALQLDKNFKYILFFGFIRDYKGLDILLKAMAAKQLKDEKIRCLVAGEFYTDENPYREIIEKNNIQDKVIMQNDFIPDSEVANYFCASDIVVQPYKTATQSGVTQIAFHFNKPMIVTRVGGLPEIVPDGKIGYVTEPDPEEIAEAILKFYNENKEKEFIENVKEEKKKYSWSRMLKTVDVLLEKMETS